MTTFKEPQLKFGIAFDSPNSKLREIFWEKAEGLFVDAEKSDRAPLVVIELMRNTNQVSDGEFCGIWRERNGRDDNVGLDLDKPMVRIQLVRYANTLVVETEETFTRVRMDNVYATVELVVKAIYDYLSK